MKYEKLLRSVLDDGLYEQLNKALTKLSTSSVVDIGEVYHSLKVAPKAVLSFLVRALKGMDKQEKEIPLPWDTNAALFISKQAADVYKGYIKEKGTITHEFSLTSLPALAAHLTSHFELYVDEKSEKKDNTGDRLHHLELKLQSLQLQSLEAKVNELLAISTNKVHKSEDLAKAGLMPTMPAPPKPGIKVGGNQGITETGIRGMKTAATDRMSKPVSAIVGKPQIAPKISPGIKGPAAAKSENKTLTFNKADSGSKCLECGEAEFDKGGLYKGCSCWKGMSKPTVKKSDSNSVTLEFKPDWEMDDLIALIRSVKKYE